MVHEELIRQILENLSLPEEIAVVHVKGYQQGNSLVERGNTIADEKAKESALQLEGKAKLLLVPEIKPPPEKQIFSEKKREKPSGSYEQRNLKDSEFSLMGEKW